MKKVIVLCLLILLSVCACRQQKGDTNKVEESGKNQQKKIISKVQRKALEKQKERRKEEQKELKKTQKNQFKIKGNKLIKFYWREAPKERREYDVSIPSKVKRIAKGAFKAEESSGYQRYHPINLHIPADVVLEDGSFSCMGPATITFEEGRTDIGKSFYNCAGAGYPVYLHLPNSLKRIENHGLQWADRVFLNEGLEYVGDYGLASTKTTRLPDTIKVLGKRALNSWYPISERGRPLAEYHMPNQLEKIGEHCIDICGSSNSLKLSKAINISKSVREIGHDFLSYINTGVPNGKGVQVDPRNPYFKSDKNGWVYSKDGKTLYHAYLVESVMTIPEHVENIKCTVQCNEDRDDEKVLFPNKKLEKKYKSFIKKCGENCPVY